MEYMDMSERQLKKERSKFSSEYDRIRDECLKERLPYNEFMHRAAEPKEQLYLIDKYLRLKTAATVEYGKEWKGDMMPIDEFKRRAMDGLLTDEDGEGWYATDNAKSDIKVIPSDAAENLMRTDFTHVLWFEFDKDETNQQ